MKNIFLLSLVLLFFCFTNIYTQTPTPKWEVRGAWVASVSNLDWPTSPSISSEAQMAQLITLLDSLKNVNINTVIFQIRPECDALYNSPFEPWSYWLTGTQGRAPSPYYDPLQFAIEEAHKRGMELHAWFNPYRAEGVVNRYTLANNHVVRTNPDWLITISNFRFLNPGLPQVRNHVLRVIMDVVRRYKVDGIHMDDYFYPYPPNQITNQDTATFRLNARGFTDIGDWRRDNVNLLLRMLRDSLAAVNPGVKFGMSPFGIWRPGVPPGITGLDAYATIYCDAIAWLQQRSVDYYVPQLYWRIGGSQDFDRLQRWWADSVTANNRHFYPGMIYHATYTTSELPNQLRLNRANPKVHGSVYFRGNNIRDNTLGFADTLRRSFFRNPAFPTIMNWKDVVNPNPPRNLRFDRIPGRAIAGLQWEVPLAASDHDTARFYGVYRIPTNTITPGVIDNSDHLIDITGNKFDFPPNVSSAPTQTFFTVTALDENNNESLPSNVVTVIAPSTPVLVLPSDNNNNVPPEITFTWRYASPASAYRLTIATTQDFSSGIFYDNGNLTDTSITLTGFNGMLTYFWRVSARNSSGISANSVVRSFTGGFPMAPTLVYPPNNTGNIPLNVPFSWNRIPNAASYELMVSISFDFTPASIVYDSIGVVDTVLTVANLERDRLHFWRVRASNNLGTGLWSPINRFRTLLSSIVEKEEMVPTEFKLDQNYPNPFNPNTKIRFAVPVTSDVILKIYDALGREVIELVNQELNAGVYSIEWDAKNILGIEVPSGMYIYRITADNFSQSRKMILLR
ncbi:MAG: hypothetical protein C0425_08610 [Chlorobiaceae bacterium]|nr:hypothetical protein [Chlorobiaceae bacterium]MBA4310382.1 hypothetical protein [Chlorobiaceae bacterium]